MAKLRLRENNQNNPSGDGQNILPNGCQHSFATVSEVHQCKPALMRSTAVISPSVSSNASIANPAAPVSSSIAVATSVTVASAIAYNQPVNEAHIRVVKEGHSGSAHKNDLQELEIIDLEADEEQLEVATDMCTKEIRPSDGSIISGIQDSRVKPISGSSTSVQHVAPIFRDSRIKPIAAFRKKSFATMSWDNRIKPLAALGTLRVGNRVKPFAAASTTKLPHDIRIQHAAPSSESQSASTLPPFMQDLNRDVNELYLGQQGPATVLYPSRPKAAFGERTPMKRTTLQNTNGEQMDMVLPGEAVPSDYYFGSKRKTNPFLARPQLTAPGIKTKDQKPLDDWMNRQKLTEHAGKENEFSKASK